MCFQFCRYGQPLVPMAPGTRYNLLIAAKVGSRCCAGNTAITAFEPPCRAIPMELLTQASKAGLIEGCA